MDGYPMDGWVGWIDELIVNGLNGWDHGWWVEWMDYGWIHGWVEWMDGLMDGWIHGWVEWMDGFWMDSWVG
jgi:hypothetical protein